MKTHSRRSSKRGFTLVELLVVIAIILTLAGLAIMGVRTGLRAAAAGKTTKNMKEIYTALATIQTEGVNTGHHAPNTLPPYKGNLQDGQRANFLWWDLVAEKMNIADRDSGDYRWVSPHSETMLQNPLSKKILGKGKTTYDSLFNDPDVTHGSYAYNGLLGGDVSSEAQEEGIFRVRLSAIDDPDTTIYFGEADDQQETPGYVFQNMANAPQGNYKDGAHCCMIGGNVKLIKNSYLKDKLSYDFYTQFEDKNYSHNPE